MEAIGRTWQGREGGREAAGAQLPAIWILSGNGTRKAPGVDGVDGADQ